MVDTCARHPDDYRGAGVNRTVDGLEGVLRRVVIGAVGTKPRRILPATSGRRPADAIGTQQSIVVEAVGTGHCGGRTTHIFTPAIHKPLVIPLVVVVLKRVRIRDHGIEHSIPSHSVSAGYRVVTGSCGNGDVGTARHGSAVSFGQTDFDCVCAGLGESIRGVAPSEVPPWRVIVYAGVVTGIRGFYKKACARKPKIFSGGNVDVEGLALGRRLSFGKTVVGEVAWDGLT